MEKSEKVILLSTIVLVGFTLAVIFHYILGFYLNLPYPYNSFLWGADIAFNDFTNIMGIVKDLVPYKAANLFVNYFPLAYILLFPFTFIKSKIIAYLLFASIFLSFFIYINIKNFSCKNLTRLQDFQNIFILTIISYPFLTLIDRGNIDMLLFIIFGAFIYFFKSEKYILSSVLLAILNAMKPFLAIFLFLFLFKKKYKEFFLSLILSIFLIITGFMMLKGEFFSQVSVLIINLKLFKILYAYKNNNVIGMFAGSSIFMALKLLFTRLSLTPLISTVMLTKMYDAFSLLAAPVILFFTWREKIFWKQISLLSFYMLSIPYMVNDYKLIFLFVPIWLFVNTKEKSRFDLAYIILFGLLLIPKNIIIANYIPKVYIYFSISIILNPIIMIIFISLIIFEQFYLKKKPKEE